MNTALRQVCSRCVMDTDVQGIIFDAQGVCQYCHDFDQHIQAFRLSETESKANLEAIARRVKADARGEYDSILGLSGGVDSSYVAYLAHELGLKPLAIHFDNGWNAEVAVSNIKKIVDVCGFDLETYVINWPEFRDLQRSFLKASVVDIEMVTDHAIFAAMFHYAKKHKIKYVLSGTNYTTEHGMPIEWVWRKSDIVNIRDIQSQFGTMKLKSFPVLGTMEFALIRKMGIPFRFVEMLNVANYRKTDAMAILKKTFNWEYYGDKHFESVFTRFYQGYILPVKFGIDKRKVHWSALVRNGEVSREDALHQLEKPAYSQAMINADKEYVCKKLDFKPQEFEQIMKSSPRAHTFYRSDQNNTQFLRRLYQLFLKGRMKKR